MIYLYWYLGIGIAVLGVVYGVHRLTKEKDFRFLNLISESVIIDAFLP
jgi:hypothetical protein